MNRGIQEDMFDLDAVYWTLSTVAQTMVGLVAFVGFVAIWKLQSVVRENDESRQRLSHYAIVTNLHPLGSFPSDEELLDIDAQVLEDDNLVDHNGHAEIISHQKRLTETGNRVSRIRRALTWLAGCGISATAFSLGFLAIAPRLVSTKGRAADLGWLAPAAFLVLLVLVTLALRVAWDALRLSFRE